MKRMSWILALVLMAAGVAGVLFCGAAFAQEEQKKDRETEGDKNEEKKIEELIKKLGSEKFKDRETAQKELIKIGEPAITQLKKALKDKDPEISIRAERIFLRFDREKREKSIEETLKTADRISISGICVLTGDIGISKVVTFLREKGCIERIASATSMDICNCAHLFEIEFYRQGSSDPFFCIEQHDGPCEKVYFKYKTNIGLLSTKMFNDIVGFIKKLVQEKKALKRKITVAPAEKNKTQLKINVHQKIIKGEGPVIQLEVSNFGSKNVEVTYFESGDKMYKVASYKNENDKTPQEVKPLSVKKENKKKKIILKPQEHLVVHYDLSKSFPLKKGTYRDVSSTHKAMKYYRATVEVTVDGKKLNGIALFAWSPAPSSNKKPPKIKAGTVFREGVLLVAFKGGVSQERREELLKKYGLTIIEKLTYVGTWIIRVPAGKELELHDKLFKEPEIKWVTLDVFSSIEPPRKKQKDELKQEK